MSKSPDGLRPECKSCRKGESKTYYTENTNEIKERVKNYRAENPVVKLNWELNNPIKKKQYNKKYRTNNSVKIKEYRKINSDGLKVKRRVYIRNKMATDSVFKLKHNLGSLIRISFKSRGYTKNSKTNEILGCTVEEFKQYLETKFESWMNWDNRGFYNGELNYGWDPDHIIPISSAKTEDEIIKLNHFSNFQPLCSKTNRDIKRGFWKSGLSNKQD
jgi:hypothetical protein